MRGAKRFGVSDSGSDANDSSFHNKRITVAPPVGVHRFDSSQQQMRGTPPPLDIHQAKSSQQHVRALNTQFASWVQAQLKNYPDELWEDGVRDYLAHASIIMEKFSDVVNWIKEHTAKGENSISKGSPSLENKIVPKSKSIEIKTFQGSGTGLTPTSSTTSLATPWSFGVFSNSTLNPPVSFGLPNSDPTIGCFGGQSSVLTNCNGTEDADGDVENEEEQPSSPSVKKSEEKGVVLVHEVKCKLYVKSSDPADKDAWKDKGTGKLSIKCKEGISKATKESKPTIIIRNDVGRLLLNALIYPGIKTNLQKNSLVAIFHTSGEGDGNDGGSNETVVARTFLIRLKTEEDRNKLATAIQEYAPAS